MTQAETLESMLTIRRFEEAVVGLFVEHEFMTHFHLYIGQEGTGVLLMAALGQTTRSPRTTETTATCWPAAATPRWRWPRSSAARTASTARRRHDAHERHRPRLHLDSAIVGGSISLGTGAGFALKSMGGDASRWRCSATARSRRACRTSRSTSARSTSCRSYVREQQRGALGLAGGGFTSVSAVDDLTDIPKTFGIPVETVDGRDVDAVADVAARAVQHRRERKGPFFVHAVTARFAGTQPLWPTLPTGPTDISMAWDDSNISGRARAVVPRARPGARYARKLLAPATHAGRAHRDGRARASASPRRGSSRLDSPRPTPESALDHVFA